MTVAEINTLHSGTYNVRGVELDTVTGADYSLVNQTTPCAAGSYRLVFRMIGVVTC